MKWLPVATLLAICLVLRTSLHVMKRNSFPTPRIMLREQDGVSGVYLESDQCMWDCLRSRVDLQVPSRDLRWPMCGGTNAACSSSAQSPFCTERSHPRSRTHHANGSENFESQFRICVSNTVRLWSGSWFFLKKISVARLNKRIFGSFLGSTFRRLLYGKWK